MAALFAVSLSLDIRSLSDSWFASDTQYGSVSTLHVPLTFTGKLSGTLGISFRNSLGTSNTLSVSVP